MLAALASCRDNGQGWADAGALCLSGAGWSGHAYHETPIGIALHEDKHKAPTPLHIHPLSLQLSLALNVTFGTSIRTKRGYMY